MFAGSLSLLLLAFFLWIADMRPAPEQPSRLRQSLLVFGTNAIFAYVLSEVFASIFGTINMGGGLNLQQWLYQEIHRVVASGAFAWLIYSLTYVALCWIVVYVAFYRLRIFLKI